MRQPAWFVEAPSTENSTEQKTRLNLEFRGARVYPAGRVKTEKGNSGANMSTHNVDARRRKLTLGFNVPVRVILAVFCLCAICFGQSPPTFVMDGHVHMINRQLYLGGDISDHYKDGQVDLPRIRKGGVNAIFFSIFTSDNYYPNRFELKETMILMDLALRQIRKNHDQIEMARNASDIERIYKSGKIAAFLHLEGSFDLDGDLGLLRDLYRLGLRSAMFVAHNTDTNFADSCCSPPKWNGITAHGIEVVHEMNRLGMVIDVAHASDATMRQVAAASSDPMIYSHGGSMFIVNTPRNITDETAKIIAAKGGVIGLQFGNGFNNPKYHDWLESHRESRPAALFTSSAPLLASFQAVNDERGQAISARGLRRCRKSCACRLTSWWPCWITGSKSWERITSRWAPTSTAGCRRPKVCPISVITNYSSRPCAAWILGRTSSQDRGIESSARHPPSHAETATSPMTSYEMSNLATPVG